MILRSVGFSTECFGIHIGNPQTANTGDGRGWTDEIAVMRYDYGDSGLGTCLESLTGAWLPLLSPNGDDLFASSPQQGGIIFASGSKLPPKHIFWLRPTKNGQGKITPSSQMGMTLVGDFTLIVMHYLI